MHNAQHLIRDEFFVGNGSGEFQDIRKSFMMAIFYHGRTQLNWVRLVVSNKQLLSLSRFQWLFHFDFDSSEDCRPNCYLQSTDHTLLVVQ